MDEWRITVEENPGAREVEALARGLAEHALPVTRVRGFRPLGVFARDGGGRLVGGVSALVNWNWLQISLIWVAESHRRRGLGTRLLAEVERAGAERGCAQAHLDTFSYQARPFYERHGYMLFATLEDYPPGHRRYFLRKRLAPA